MKQNDTYTHYKDNDYRFHHIAIPRSEVKLDSNQTLLYVDSAMYHEGDKTLSLYKIEGVDGIRLIDFDVPCVIYEAITKPYHMVFAREVDDYFGVKIKDGEILKRFARQEER